jgi:transposase
MLQITPQMKILVAVEPADFRRGIDGLARLCQETLRQDPFVGAVFVFRNRKGTALKVLTYDGQGFWLCHKRLSQGRFPWWPSAAEGGAWCSEMLENDRVGFIAREPLQSLRNHLRADAAR